MRYFDHDVTASMDTKIFQLRLSCGGAAVDAYWYLLERMYMDEQPICTCNANAMHVHSHCLCTDDSTLKSWIDSMVEIGLLFESDNGEIFSNRAENNIENYHEKAEKRRSAANKRWDTCKSNASAMQMQSKCNANKRKEKKIKEKGCIATQSNAIPSSEIRVVEDASSEDVAPYCSKCGLAVSFKPLQGKFDCMTHGLIDNTEVVFK